jgi:hypothetical protein
VRLDLSASVHGGGVGGEIDRGLGFARIGGCLGFARSALEAGWRRVWRDRPRMGGGLGFGRLRLPLWGDPWEWIAQL